MNEIAAIPTRYNGVQFRSRLEARWAAFFDLCGFEWEYEPFDCAGYIPDFLLCKRMLVEIKPVTWGERANETAIHTAQDTIAKAFPDGRFYWIALLGAGVYEYAPGISLIGKVATRQINESRAREVFGERFDSGLWNRTHHVRDAYGNGSSSCDSDLQWDWSDLHCQWNRCFCPDDECPGGEISLEGQPVLRGHHPIDEPSFTALWREAGNLVQWRGVAAQPEPRR